MKMPKGWEVVILQEVNKPLHASVSGATNWYECNLVKVTSASLVTGSIDDVHFFNAGLAYRVDEIQRTPECVPEQIGRYTDIYSCWPDDVKRADMNAFCVGLWRKGYDQKFFGVGEVWSWMEEINNNQSQ